MSVLEDVAALGNLKGEVGVLFDHTDSDALRMNSLNGFEDAIHKEGGESHRRFVHADEAWATHERAPKGKHLLFAAAEDAAALGETFLEAGKQFKHARVILGDGGRVGAGIRANEEVFADGHVGKDAAGFRDGGDAATDDFWGRQRGDVLPVEIDIARARFDEPEDDFHGGAFAAGVAAEEADDFGGVDVKVEVKVDLRGTVEGVDVRELEKGGISHSRVTPHPLPPLPLGEGETLLQEIKSALPILFPAPQKEQKSVSLCLVRFVTQIRFDDVWVIADLVGYAFGDFFAIVHDDDALGELHDE